MSDEAENAASGQAIRTYTRAKEAKAKLEGQMWAFGEKLERLAKALKEPNRHAFRTAANNLAISEPEVDRHAFVELWDSDFDWRHLIEMLNGFEKARADKHTVAQTLRDMGLPIPN